MRVKFRKLLVSVLWVGHGSSEWDGWEGDMTGFCAVHQLQVAPHLPMLPCSLLLSYRAHNYVVILTEVCIFLLSLVSLLRENHQCCVFSQEDTVQNLFPKDHSSDSFFKIASALFCFYPCYCCKNHLRAYERAALMAVYSLGKDFAPLSSHHAQFEAAPPTQLSFPNCTAQRDTYHPSIKV